MGRKSYQYLPLSKEKYGALKDGVTDSDDRYEIRERLRHTLSNGYVIWQGQGIDPKTFETIEEHGDGVKQRFDKDEIEETKRLTRSPCSRSNCWRTAAGIVIRPRSLTSAVPMPSDFMLYPQSGRRVYKS